jgi:hypothetical protein
MNLYTAIPSAQYSDQKHLQPVHFQADSLNDAKDWIVNHYDCSYQWYIAPSDEITIQAANLTKD